MADSLMPRNINIRPHPPLACAPAVLAPVDTRGVHHAYCGWEGCMAVLGTLWPYPGGYELAQNCAGRRMRRRAFAIRPGLDDRSYCPICHRPNTIVPPGKESIDAQTVS
jgi:hypothetical protein